MSSAGSTPAANITRQARSGSTREYVSAYSSTAAPQPTAHALCTVPIALPRWLARMLSAISTAPAAHSPPKPKPCTALSARNCSKFCAKAEAKVASENHATVICSVRTRPRRSVIAPAIQPPRAEATSVMPDTSPASVLPMCHAAMMVGMTRLNICTSSASSAQPPKHAQKVRFSPAEISLNQPNMPSPPGDRRAASRTQCSSHLYE